MTSNYASRLQAIFAAAVDHQADALPEFLEHACDGDESLLAELRAMLAMDRELQCMTARRAAPGLARAADVVAPPPSLTGLRVGAFELREELGSGGMGRVYRAERVDGTVTQEVAIKFVRRELLDSHTLKRFQLERQLVATLDHPHIARLLDAAELEDATPYYVMEYVAGAPITEFCARQRLGLRERVALVRKVCNAVAEAHRKLIVHRDLKPANILITALGAPKLLDFGIAKPLSVATDGEATGPAQRYFSPNYAAPEQLTGAPVGVSCDVYALGLLLYELVAGCRPFELAGLSPGQAERLITQVSPVAPSAALARGVTPTAEIHPRQLRGDLDGIILRCLRKIPAERYASVERLETDLGNYLDGRPVQARGDRAWYRARKFVRRNLLVVSAGVLVTLSLVSGVLAFAWQARIAEQRAAELAEVSRFQAEMLSQVDPALAGIFLTQEIAARLDEALAKAGVSDDERQRERTGLAALWRRINATDVSKRLLDRAILKPAVEAIPQRFSDQPLVSATLHQALASRYREIAAYQAALPLQELALAARQQWLGDGDPSTLESVVAMGQLLIELQELERARTYLESGLAAARRDLGENHPRTVELTGAIGYLLLTAQKPAEAEPYFREALRRQSRAADEQTSDTLVHLDNLANALFNQGRLREAEAYFREALERRRATLGSDHPRTIESSNNLGRLLHELGRYEDAEPLLRAAEQAARRVYGEEHPMTMKTINNIALLLRDQGHFDEAEPYFRESLEGRRRSLGDEHLMTLTAVLNMGNLRRSQGRLDEAEALYLGALETLRRVHGDDTLETTVTVFYLGILSRQQGRLDAAERYSREAYDRFKAKLGEDNPRTLSAAGNIGQVLQARGRLSEAESYFRDGLQRRRRVLGDENPATLISITNLGSIHVAKGEFAEAESLLAPAEAAARKRLPGDPARLADFLLTLGRARAKLGRLASAEAMLLEAYTVFGRLPGRGSDPTDCVRALVELYDAWAASEPGSGHAEQANEWRRKLAQPSS